MKILFDSSALFKRYAGEAGTRAVLDLHAKASHIVLAPHCLTELMSALTRQWREGAFGDAEFARVRARMRGHACTHARLPTQYRHREYQKRTR